MRSKWANGAKIANNLDYIRHKIDRTCIHNFQIVCRIRWIQICMGAYSVGGINKITTLTIDTLYNSPAHIYFQLLLSNRFVRWFLLFYFSCDFILIVMLIWGCLSQELIWGCFLHAKYLDDGIIIHSFFANIRLDFYFILYRLKCWSISASIVNAICACRRCTLNVIVRQTKYLHLLYET